MDHLTGYREDGTDVIGIYPLLSDGTCRFLVFDFDNHEKGAEATDFSNKTEEWHKQVDAVYSVPSEPLARSNWASPTEGESHPCGD